MGIASIRVRGRSPRRTEVVAEIPNLIEIQLDSYHWFHGGTAGAVPVSFSPIEDFTGNLALSFCDPSDDEPKYSLGEPKYDIYECRDRDATFEAPLKARVWLHNRRTGEIKESEVYLGELPIMTENGTFVINGAERCVVSQLARSPGVYFRDTIDFSGRILYSAQVIPSEGAWLDIDSDANETGLGEDRAGAQVPGDHAAARAARHQPGPRQREAAVLHRRRPHAPLRPAGEAGEDRHRATLVGRRVWERVVDTDTGEVIAEAGQRLRPSTWPSRSCELAPESLQLAVLHPLHRPDHGADPTHTEEEALIDIYRRERPGRPGDAGDRPQPPCRAVRGQPPLRPGAGGPLQAEQEARPRACPRACARSPRKTSSPSCAT